MPLGLSLKLSSGGGADSPYSAEAQAYFAAMTTQGGAAYKTAVNAFIEQLKSDGVWASLDSMHLFANKNDSTDAVPASWINMISPSDAKAAKIGAPTYVAYQGWKGATASAINLNQYLTGRAKYKLNSASVFVYVYTNPANGYVATVGAYNDTTQQTFLMHRFDANGSIRAALNSSLPDLTGITNNGVGLYCLNRTANTGFDIYKDGSFLGAVTASSGTIPTAPVYALASNVWNAGTSTYDPKVEAANRVVSLVGFGAQMDATKQLKLSQAFATYMAAAK